MTVIVLALRQPPPFQGDRRAARAAAGTRARAAAAAAAHRGVTMTVGTATRRLRRARPWRRLDRGLESQAVISTLSLALLNRDFFSLT